VAEAREKLQIERIGDCRPRT